MFDIVTEKQKDNVAKFLYDGAKITLATLVLSPFTNKEPMKTWVLIVGILVTFICILSKKHGKRSIVEAQILMDTQFC